MWSLAATKRLLFLFRHLRGRRAVECAPAPFFVEQSALPERVVFTGLAYGLSGYVLFAAAMISWSTTGLAFESSNPCDSI